MGITKFGSINITLLFAAFVFFAALEAPKMVEAQKSCDAWASRTMTGHCPGTPQCNKHCIQHEKAHHGSCFHSDLVGGLGTKCACYPCP
ncbi:hypothetical protein AALP_AA2G201300 [Arabis alpina]|uniref:Knottin scorpion toxin-like domain-containing protein n=1 Tax=Arabis alpina TaxID=50452 RepID=A0A087HIR2_ARAAL|nr:hypothetical protein AALP_AA2G201300 [Arabis alpina]